MTGQPDCFIIINGPQDGVEFPIVRAPFHIGQEPSCAVNVRLDSTVCPFHALVTAVSDGYRVRKVEGGALFVDGRSAGTLRSRIVRAGGTIQVGHTLLTVECAPDGLASRSHGVTMESDAAWAAGEALASAARGVKALSRFVGRILGRLLTSWLAVFAALFLLYLYWPWFRLTVNHLVGSAYNGIIQGVLGQFFGGQQ